MMPGLPWKLITAIRAIIGIFEPFLDAMIPKDVLAFG
jgi:hypothetical protein